jgi:dihydropteroate synthase
MVKILGILNLTPDSFFDGGKYNSNKLALQQVEKMLFEGADIIDIGAESTKPNSQPLTSKQEQERLFNILPQVIEYVNNFNTKHHKNIKISLDSYHFSTIKAGLELGIKIINDISGLVDNHIIDLALQYQCQIVLMHNLAIHSNPNLIINPNLNIVAEIFNWAMQKIKLLVAKGIKKTNIIFDPGLGFSKNASQCIKILKEIKTYHNLEVPILVGHSQKSFLDAIEINDLSRSQKTLLISKYLAQNQVQYLRVHNVGDNHNAIFSF